MARALQILVGNLLHEEEIMGQFAGNGSVESTLKDLGHDAKSRIQDVKDTAADMGARVGGFVKDHPIPAILTGVGIGFLIGRLLTR